MHIMNFYRLWLKMSTYFYESYSAIYVSESAGITFVKLRKYKSYENFYQEEKTTGACFFA